MLVFHATDSLNVNTFFWIAVTWGEAAWSPAPWRVECVENSPASARRKTLVTPVMSGPRARLQAAEWRWVGLALWAGL